MYEPYKSAVYATTILNALQIMLIKRMNILRKLIMITVNQILIIHKHILDRVRHKYFISGKSFIRRLTLTASYPSPKLSILNFARQITLCTECSIFSLICVFHLIVCFICQQIKTFFYSFNLSAKIVLILCFLNIWKFYKFKHQ